MFAFASYSREPQKVQTVTAVSNVTYNMERSQVIKSY